MAFLMNNNQNKNKYIDFESLLKDQILSDKIAQTLIAYWRYLNVGGLTTKEAALKEFFEDEKTKVDFVDKIEADVFPVKGKTVMDIGCGKGGVLISCALRGAKVVGFDISEQEIRIAVSRINSAGILNAEVFKGDAERIPFPRNSFDLISITSVLEHVAKVDRVLEEVVRVMRPGGICCITGPNPLFPREGHYKVFYPSYLPKRLGGTYLKIRGYNPEFFINEVVYPYPSISKITRSLRNKGLKVRNITRESIMAKFADPTSIETLWMRRTAKCLKTLGVNTTIARAMARFYPYSGAVIVGIKRK